LFTELARAPESARLLSPQPPGDELASDGQRPATAGEAGCQCRPGELAAVLCWPAAGGLLV
jgi:hypothetical protein